MEKHLGRELKTSEYVHHKNHDKLDNRIENLEIMDPGTHARLHLQKYPITKMCAVCGAEFTPHKTKRKRAVTCGRKECVIAAQQGRYGRGL